MATETSPGKHYRGLAVFAFPLPADPLLKYILKFVETTDTSSVQMRPEAEAESRMLIGKAAADHLTAEFQRICPTARIVESVEGRLRMSMVRSPDGIDEDLIPQSEKLAALEELMSREGFNEKPGWFRDL